MSDPASTKELDDTDEWLELIKETPLRSIEDIAANREPLWVKPVLALGMQREYPHPPSLYTGPRWWHLSTWLLWNFGDWLPIRKKTQPNGKKPKRGRHRLVRGMSEVAVYRPKACQVRGEAASPPQKHLSLSREQDHVPRRIAL